MKTVLGVLSVVCVIIAVVFSVFLAIDDYNINRDILGWQTRAQVSSEPHDMHDYMVNVKTGMEKWGMTTGYAAMIFKTPYNDMKLIYRTVQQNIDQAEVLTTMDRSTPEYQTGLDNLRGSIRELDLQAFWFYVVNQGMGIFIPCVIGWLLFIVFILWWNLTY
jgi:hypothetical protein